MTRRMKPFFLHNTTRTCLRPYSSSREQKTQIQRSLSIPGITRALSFNNNVWSKQQILFLFQHQLGKFQHPIIIISPRTDRDPRLGAFDVRKRKLDVRKRPLRVHREGRRHERTHVVGLRTKRQKVMSDSFP
jgi:hypothetical protein